MRQKTPPQYLQSAEKLHFLRFWYYYGVNAAGHYLVASINQNND